MSTAALTAAELESARADATEVWQKLYALHQQAVAGTNRPQGDPHRPTGQQFVAWLRDMRERLPALLPLLETVRDAAAAIPMRPLVRLANRVERTGLMMLLNLAQSAVDFLEGNPSLTEAAPPIFCEQVERLIEMHRQWDCLLEEAGIDLTWVAWAGQQAAAATPAADTTPIPDRFSTEWPLGMRADMAARKVKRGDTVVDFGSSGTVWEVLVMLADNFPDKTPAKDLWDDEYIELGAVYARVSALRQLLAPLGITIPHPGRQGYVLKEAPAPKP